MRFKGLDLRVKFRNFFHKRYSRTKPLTLNIQHLFISAPTTKAVGSKDVTKLEPTALVVGLQKIRADQTFETPSPP